MGNRESVWLMDARQVTNQVQITPHLQERWQKAVSLLDFAFQPIVNVYSGTCFGYEVLLRNYQDAGFVTIAEVFDSACREQVLYSLDLLLREKAIAKFCSLPNHTQYKLFYNFDNRVLEMPDYCPGNTSRILARYDLAPESVYFEVSEHYKFQSYQDTRRILEQYRRQCYRIALDDFGSGFSGMQLLYHAEPDLIKIDRFFIDGIASDSRKRLFVSNIINMAHILGILVVGEGVETEEEFQVCKQIGCDLIQGFFIQKPMLDCTHLLPRYENIALLSARERRKRPSDRNLIETHLSPIPPVSAAEDVDVLFKRFRHGSHPILPVVNNLDEPLGVIREQDLKTYVYSRYGYELLQNKTKGKRLDELIHKCPLAEIHTAAEKVLQIFSFNANSAGILITNNGKYLGFLTAQSLLKVINEKNISEARNQNPLTRLPGNNLINQYLFQILEDTQQACLLVYLDLDFFKPFNDSYGFRRGDRVLMLLAEILRKHLDCGTFIGHIGGDDFFVGFSVPDNGFTACYQKVRTLQEKFCRDVRDLYDREDREQGYIVAKDRDNRERTFPLLQVSAALLYLGRNKQGCSLDTISSRISLLKKSAKESKDHTASASLYPGK